MAKRKSKVDDHARLREAEGWLDLGSAADALKELEKISSSGASDIEVLRARYAALASTEQWRFALLVSEVAVHMFPKISETWLWRAHSLRALSKSAVKARDALKPAGELFPDDPIIMLNLALYEKELGHPRKAKEWLSKARKAATGTRANEMVRTLVEQDAGLRDLWLSLED